MPMLKKLTLLFALLFCGTSVYAKQSEIATGMGKLADTLTGSYLKSGAANRESKIAVFEFNTSKELEERRIGFAVSELLAHHIIAKSGFTVVERLGLDKILSELKISMAGVTDPDDAVKAGKLGGAKLVVLGSVEKIGSKYHVNARIVEVETGYVVSTAYESFPILVFEDEAKDYIVRVPETQALGLYFLYNSRYNSNELPDTTYNGLTWSWQPVLKDYPSGFNLGLVGGGIRYQPTAQIMVDFSLSVSESRVKAGTTQLKNYYGGWDFPDSYFIKVAAYRGLVSLRLKVLDSLIFYPGAGATSYKIYGGAKSTYVTPTINARIEFLPQSRIGVSLAGYYDFTSKAAVERSMHSSITKNRRAELNKFYIESTLSVYF